MKILGVAHTKNRQFLIIFALRDLKLGVPRVTPDTKVGSSLLVLNGWFSSKIERRL
jgi:hypothetical protein